MTERSIDSSAKPTPEASTSILGSIRDGFGKFGLALTYEAIEAPTQAAYQLANESTGKHLPGLELTKPDDSAWSTAGALVGTVTKYVVLSKLVHNAVNPGEVRAADRALTEGLLTTVKRSSFESGLTGAAAGFLTPVENTQDFWKEKAIATTVSAGSFATMGGTSAALGKSEFMGSMKGSLARTAAVNGLAGLTGGTMESALDAHLHDRSMTLDKTLKTAGSYALFGVALGGVAHLAGGGAPEYKATSTEASAERPAGQTLRQFAQQSLQTIQDHTSRLGSKLDEQIWKINPLNPANSGMQLAYEGARAGGRNPIRAYYPEAPTSLGETRMYSVAHQQGRSAKFEPAPAANADKAGSDIRLVVDNKAGRKATPKGETTEGTTPEKTEAPEKKPVADKAAKTYSIESVLAKTERGSEIATALETINEEYPNFLRGVKSKYEDVLGGGRDTILIELADGKYKNAVLRFTTIFGRAQDTLTPTEWNAEWGHRPYDAPLLSKVHDAELGGGDRLHVYVQEKGEGAVKQDNFYDAYEDTTFAKDASDPSFHKMMEELEARGEEFVDPGSRQLVWSQIKQRLVLVDYPAVMRSSEIPAEFRDADGSGAKSGRNAYEAENEPNERDYDDSDEEPLNMQEVKDTNLEERRYNFMHRKATPETSMQNDIAQQIFDGDSDKDIASLLPYLHADALKSLGISAKEAVKATRELMKQKKLF